jgi:hypothetical protein
MWIQHPIVKNELVKNLIQDYFLLLTLTSLQNFSTFSISQEEKILGNEQKLHHQPLSR